MITTEGPFKPLSGVVNIIYTNDNGGKIVKTGQPANFVVDDEKAKGVSSQVSYNAGLGNTSMAKAWVGWTAAQCDVAGISTADMDPTKPTSKKTIEIDVPQANVNTVKLFEDKNDGFFDLYEQGDARKARHKTLRDAGLTPPFPRADKFLQNKHLENTQVGLTTEGSY